MATTNNGNPTKTRRGPGRPRREDSNIQFLRPHEEAHQTVNEILTGGTTPKAPSKNRARRRSKEELIADIEDEIRYVRQTAQERINKLVDRRKRLMEGPEIAAEAIAIKQKLTPAQIKAQLEQANATARLLKQALK